MEWETVFKIVTAPVASIGTAGVIIFALSSCSLGISSLEKHITLNKSMYGSDQKISLDPKELKSLVDNVRKIEISFGNGELYIDKDEFQVMDKLRSNLKR